MNFMNRLSISHISNTQLLTQTSARQRAGAAERGWSGAGGGARLAGHGVGLSGFMLYLVGWWLFTGYNWWEAGLGIGWTGNQSPPRYQDTAAHSPTVLRRPAVLNSSAIIYPEPSLIICLFY